MRSLPIGLTLVLAVASSVFVRAETFVLTQGGKITGELLNPDENPRKTYEVKTPDGAVVTLESSQVKQVIRPKPAEIEYEKIRSSYADTVEGQWELAEWCRIQGLRTQRKVHLQRVVELEPNHKQARYAMGFVWKDGRWTTQEEDAKARGLVQYKGRWVTPEEVEIDREKQKRGEAESEWVRSIEKWKNWLGTDRDRFAREKLLEIKDPAALQGLVRSMDKTPSPQGRVILAKAMANLGTPDAKLALAKRSLLDDDDDVRDACLSYLKKVPDPKLVEFYVARLKDKNPSIAQIRRAATALKEMGDPSAIGPLIDVLVTFHKFKVPTGSPGMGGAFNKNPGGGSSGPGGGITMNAPKFQTIVERSENRAVLEALVALAQADSGEVNYGFNVDAWRSWHAGQKRRQSLDKRS